MQKLLLLFVTVLGLHVAATAQDWEEHIITKPGVGIARAVALGDLDNDSINDIAIMGHKGVGWYRGNGFGVFEFVEILSDHGDEENNIQVADMDNDGDNDIVFDARFYGEFKNIPPPIGSPQSILVFIHENLGGGNFAERQLVAVDTGGVCIELMTVDMDLDGGRDILFTTKDRPPHSNNIGRVAWVQNLGGGTYSGVKQLSKYTSEVNAAYTADLNGDTLPDVIYSLIGWDTVMWKQNEGGGVFSDSMVVCSNVDNVTALSAIDMDNDGDSDVLVVSNAGKLSIIENLGSGSFAERVVISNGINDRIYAVDIDMDGNNDVLTATESTNGLTWVRNLGGGQFQNLAIPLPLGVLIKNILSGNLDSDNFPDILTLDETSNQNGRIAWHKNLTLANIGPRTNIGPEVMNVDKVILADVDGDNDKDILAIASARSEIMWFECLGNENFDATHHNIPIGSYTLRVVLLEDMNNDSSPDIVAITGDSKIILIENNGGVFGSPQPLATLSAYARYLLLEDIDGNGFRDIVYTLESENRVEWLSNQGNGVFSSPQTLVAGVFEPSHLLFNDINGDGLRDIVVETSSPTMAYQQTISWVPNLGNGSFGTIAVAIDPYYIQNTTASDLNGDGNADLITLTSIGYANVLKIFQNQGAGTFGSELPLPSTIYASSLATGDMEVNGSIDIVYSHNSISYLSNQGNLTFNTIPVKDSWGASCPIHLADINEDGNLDILAATHGYQIAWLENPGNLVGTNSIEPNDNTQLYPNPTTGTFTINLGKSHDKATVSITTIKGQLLQSQTYTQAQLIDLEIDGAAGMYFVTVETESGREVIKLVKE